MVPSWVSPSKSWRSNSLVRRSQMGKRVEGFWVACGVAFLLGAFWQLLGLAWPLLPVLLMLLGAVFLGKVVIGLTR